MSIAVVCAIAVTDRVMRAVSATVKFHVSCPNPAVDDIYAYAGTIQRIVVERVQRGRVLVNPIEIWDVLHILLPRCAGRANFFYPRDFGQGTDVPGSIFREPC